MSNLNRTFLDRLHEKLAETLMEKLESGEITASELSVIRQFLNDNHVSLVDNKMTDMARSVSSLPNFDDLKIQ